MCVSVIEHVRQNSDYWTKLLSFAMRTMSSICSIAGRRGGGFGLDHS